MDRNHVVLVVPAGCWLVALRKESVDRNITITTICIARKRSLSARRAWIEIGCWRDARRALGVALRKESVDRNRLGFCHCRDDVSSLSARRAWIEIVVSLALDQYLKGRSPQGERG